MQIETVSELVETIISLIDAEQIPPGYIDDLKDVIQRYDQKDYDLLPDTDASPADIIHIQGLLRTSYWLFGLRVLNFQLLQAFRNENFRDGIRDLESYRKKLEAICRRFDRSYMSKLPTIHSPTLNTSFWVHRGQSNPVTEMTRFITSY